ncbi:hypothetical protein K439DRAFT_1613415 [Ramaria rubella]|nr:hypothetical protein K439DRAFT_1613415 [Ramaria rubella]
MVSASTESPTSIPINGNMRLPVRPKEAVRALLSHGSIDQCESYPAARAACKRLKNITGLVTVGSIPRAHVAAPLDLRNKSAMSEEATRKASVEALPTEDYNLSNIQRGHNPSTSQESCLVASYPEHIRITNSLQGKATDEMRMLLFHELHFCWKTLKCGFFQGGTLHSEIDSEAVQQRLRRRINEA